MPENTMADSDSIEFIRQVAGFCENWDKTEKWIKVGEQLNSKVMIPSINEMRYAGRRLVDACRAAQNGSEKEAAQHFLEAKANLITARHDVVDASITYIDKKVNQINDDLGAANFKNNFPKYGEVFALLKKIENQISESRKDRTRREEIYDKITKENMPTLIALYDELILSLPAIEQNIKKKAWQPYITHAITFFLALLFFFITN